MQLLGQRPARALARAGYHELFKDSRQAVHPAVLKWLQRNSLTGAAEQERRTRQRHIEALLESRLAAGWPAWMVRALGGGAGPVWAPVARGQDAAQRWRAMRMLHTRYAVVSGSKPFNWSGDPLRPTYEMCLAVPVHGGVAEFTAIVAALDATV